MALYYELNYEKYLLMTNVYELEDDYQSISYHDAHDGLKKIEYFKDSLDI